MLNEEGRGVRRWDGGKVEGEVREGETGRAGRWQKVDKVKRDREWGRSGDVGGGWRRRGFTDTRAPGKRRGEEKKSRSGPEVMLGSIKHCTGLRVLLASPLIGSPSGSSSDSFSLSPSSDSSSFIPILSSVILVSRIPDLVPLLCFLIFLLLCLLLIPLCLFFPSFSSPFFSTAPPLYLLFFFHLFLCLLLILPYFILSSPLCSSLLFSWALFL